MSAAPAPTFKVGLTAEEKDLYSKLFKALDPESTGIVTGEKARATFEKTGLPPNILGEVWQLADTNNLGFLSQFGFCYAMRLIGYTQAGHYPTAQLADTPGPLPKFADMQLPPSALRSQSTSSSLLQTQPSALIPQNTATQQSSPQDPVAPVAPADYERFSQMFVKTTGSPTAMLDGNAARDILMKAKLPTVTLGQIWGLVDVNNRGALDLPSFVMAMHLIHGVLSGTVKQLPPFLPEHVWRSVNRESGSDRQVSQTSISSQSSILRHPPAQQQKPASEWAVSALQKQQFDNIFDSLDKAKSGSLAADQVASFLMTSRLDQQDLASIWDLSDIQNTGIFSKLEFGIALFLINRRRSGLPLPNVVPEELISSLQGVSAQSTGSQQPPQQPPVQQSPEKAPPKPKSSMDELADIFGSPGPSSPAAGASTNQISPQKPVLQQRTSSSDLYHQKDLPKVRQQLTSSFRPTSNFGQSLVAQQPPRQDDLIGGDVAAQTPTGGSNVSNQPAPEPAPASRAPTVDYEALRNVPPPPKSRSNTGVTSPLGQAASPLRQTSSPLAQSASPAPAVEPATQNKSIFPDNNDLLADSEVSGKLSEASSDIANISNQIKSMSTQTSNLHEKKMRAESELARILAVKEEINAKLKMLRTSYGNEVKQVEQVNATLANAKEETEALRSEASIAEAKLNNVSNELHEKQLAVEEHQKINSSLKEKLGTLNAEISELEKQLENKTAEKTRLSNDANVKKSQAQVAMVKADDLKSQILETQEHVASLLKEIETHEKDRLAAEAQAKELEKKHAEVTEGKSKAESQHKSVFAGAAGLIGGAALGAAAAVAGVHKSDDAKAVEEPQPVQKEEQQAQIPGSLAPEETPATSQAPTVAGLVDEVKEHPAEDLTGLDDVSKTEENTTHEADNQKATSEPSISGLVDEVKEHPAADLTGLDDAANVEDEGLYESNSKNPPEYDDFDGAKSRFPEIPSGLELQNRESASSAATGSYKPTEGGESAETPVTSPNTSEYRYNATGSGLSGGMVGMPGVPVGVQRTESLTSSIQNNPSMSVRDDNIDVVSDRDTIEDSASFAEEPARHNKDTRYEESSEGERLSSGVESFEIVNAEDARGGAKAPGEGTHPLAHSHGTSDSTSVPVSRTTEEEFPSPQELDYDESSSDSEQEEDRFDDAVDRQPQEMDELDADFNDLKPAEPETQTAQDDDFFDEEFDNLKLAEADDGAEFDNNNDVSMDDHFTGADGQFNSTMPDFSGAANAGSQDTDEWEQLFAGFGNAQPANATASAPSDPTHDLAIQELVGMGFERDTVVDALEKENYNVEAATNYLLDHA